MRVSIHFAIISDLGSESVTSLQQNALEAWENRPQGSTSTRVLQELTSKHSGQHFRFYDVMQKDENCLIVR